jgi:hypothetical protein
MLVRKDWRAVNVIEFDDGVCKVACTAERPVDDYLSTMDR